MSLASGLTRPLGRRAGRSSFPRRGGSGQRGQRALSGPGTGRGAEGRGQGHRVCVAEAAERGQQPREPCTCEHRDFQLSVFHRARISSRRSCSRKPWGEGGGVFEFLVPSWVCLKKKKPTKKMLQKNHKKNKKKKQPTIRNKRTVSKLGSGGSGAGTAPGCAGGPAAAAGDGQRSRRGGTAGETATQRKDFANCVFNGVKSTWFIYFFL